ncbi:MAG: efflux RND transporter periplasmic adaptor subunit [Pirellulales bacterium]
MSSRLLSRAGIVALALVGGLLAVMWPRPREAPTSLAKAAPAGKAAHPIHEDDLNTVTLTADAEQSLGLKTAKVQRRSAARARTYGGEITVPVGQSVLVAAPVQGMLEAVGSGPPLAGAVVKQGQALFELWPLMTPEARTTLAASRVDAEGLVETTRTQLDAAKIALDRAQRLLQNGAGSQRLVDEAQAAHDVANKAWEAAKSRKELLTKALTETTSGTADSIAICSPRDGLLRSVTAQPDQNVPAGAPLFEVVELNTVWVRTPVSVGDLEQIDVAATAEVGNLTARPGEAHVAAQPAVAPPSADPLAATVNLFYSLDNRQTRFLPGQRVGVQLALRGAESALSAPWSAVVHDIYGGTWVYETRGPRTYARQRVVVDHVADGTALLASGPAEGTSIVAEGAVELFGIETGFSK